MFILNSTAQNVSSPLRPCPISRKGIIILTFISKGFQPGMSFFSISLLEYNDDDQLQLLQDNLRQQGSPCFFSKLFSIEIPLASYSGQDEVRFNSSFSIEVSIRIYDDWSHCPDDMKEGKFSVVPPDDDCLESCSFWDTLDWYDEVLASSGVFWGDSGMKSEGNFNV